MKRSISLLILALALLGAGCGDKKGGIGGIGGIGGDGWTPVTPTSPTSSLSGGATIALNLTDKSTLDDYMGWTSCAPTDVKVNVNLKRQAYYSGGDEGFGGSVSVTFKDPKASCGGTASPVYVDTFSSMLVTSGANTKKNNTENHVYNLLSNTYPGYEGMLAYHGFFEQRVYTGSTVYGGGLILVIDSTNDLNDGAGPTTANGSIYYKNYIVAGLMGPLPATSCWFISKGPYDCRAWAAGTGVNTKAGLHPDNGYIKLGTFTGLDIKKAFNGQI